VILQTGMAHPRTLVREAVIAALTNTTAAGVRVTDTKVEPHRKHQLPAISVYTLHELARPDSEMAEPRELTRDVKVEIVAWVAPTLTVSAAKAMDNIALEIEVVMDAQRYLSGAAGDSILEDTEMQIVEDDGGDPLIGIIVLTYSVTYRTQPSDSVLDDFLRAKATYSVGGGVADTVPTVDGPFNVQVAP
jgi:hypothetical protein